MPKTLLLADDSVVIQKLVGLSFANEDIELVTVDNGDDAVTRAQELNPDLVLADVVMPGMSGHEVFLALKKINPDVKVLLSSGYSVAGEASEILRAGARGFLDKPFRLSRLASALNPLLEGP